MVISFEDSIYYFHILLFKIYLVVENASYVTLAFNKLTMTYGVGINYVFNIFYSYFAEVYDVKQVELTIDQPSKYRIKIFFSEPSLLIQHSSDPKCMLHEFTI